MEKRFVSSKLQSTPSSLYSAYGAANRNQNAHVRNRGGRGGGSQGGGGQGGGGRGGGRGGISLGSASKAKKKEDGF